MAIVNQFIPATRRLESIADRLSNASRVRPFSSREWRNEIPARPGIYAVWPKLTSVKAVYVGESSNLWERLADFGKPANHTFVKKIKNKIGLQTTAEVQGHIRRKYLVSVLPISFGRAEAEEYLVSAWRTHLPSRFNDPIPRRWRCDPR